MSYKQILTGFLFCLLCIQVFSQIKYVDIQPDIRLAGINHLPLDLDSNGTIDFILIHDTVLGNWPNEGSQINAIHHMGINEIVGLQNGHFFPKALNFNFLLNEQSKFWGNFEDNLALYVWVITNGVKSYHGNWQYMSEDHFVGFRMQSNSGRLYGWIRLFVSPDGTYMIFKDYAYMKVPEMQMYTGEGMPVDPVVNVYVKDVFDFGDGRDLQLTFNSSTNEIPLSHYRVLIVKSTDTITFNLEKAKQIPSENYIKIYPGQQNHLITFDANTKDINGEFIKSTESYVVYVLSVGKCLNNPPFALSLPSAEIKLSGNSSLNEAQKERKVNISQSGNQLFVRTIEEQIENVEVYLCNGQLIFSVNCHSSEISINTETWINDFVILKVNTAVNSYKIKYLLGN